MGVVGQRRLASFNRHIGSRGEPTKLNGATLQGLWQDAQVARVQLFLHENEWGLASFEVRLLVAALSAPYSIRNGMEITRVNLGWRGVVRDVTVESTDATVIQVNCLCVLTTD